MKFPYLIFIASIVLVLGGIYRISSLISVPVLFSGVTQGDVVDSDIICGGYRSPGCLISVHYSYSVNGMDYHSWQLASSLLAGRFLFESDAQRFLDKKFSPKMKVRVYYVPSSPQNSVLIPDVSWFDYVCAMVMMGLGILGAVRFFKWRF